MKAIIIQDTDARALLDKLTLESMRTNGHHANDAASVHRAFHYIVVRWLQDQGADVVGNR